MRSELLEAIGLLLLGNVQEEFEQQYAGFGKGLFERDDIRYRLSTSPF